jgi:hypothetical protein
MSLECGGRSRNLSQPVAPAADVRRTRGGKRRRQLPAQEPAANDWRRAQKSLRERRLVGGAMRPKNKMPQKQNGSWCRHQPPLVPGPNCRAGEGLASFLGGSGLSRRSKLRRGPCRVPAEVLRPRSVPFRGSFGRSLRFRWTLEESGIGLRLTLLLRRPAPPLRWLASRRTPPASAVAALWNFLPLREVRSSSRTALMPRLPESRQGESWPFCLWITGISWISRGTRSALSESVPSLVRSRARSGRFPEGRSRTVSSPAILARIASGVTRCG